nr:reverse transcriptase domain-containing protein [Tanacetum cinerariifolium]
ASARKKTGDSASSTTPPTPTPITTAESAPRLTATAKGKQTLRATTPVEPTDLQRTEAEQLKIVLKRSRQETHISQQSGSGTGEGTGSKPGVPDVPSDDSEEELSWKSSDDEDIGSHEKGKESDESNNDTDEGSDNGSDETVKSGAGKDGDEDDDEDDDDNDEEEELTKDDEEEKETSKGGDEVRESEGEGKDEEETSEEEEGSFDLIPRTPEDSEKESDDEEEQESRLSEEARIQEEEDAEELYRDVNINQGMGLQVTQNVKDTHVTLTPVNPDGPQESSSMSSFVSSMLNPLNDVGVESIFTTTSSPIVSLATPTPIMTPSIIATITTSGEAPIPPPIIPSIILENLPTFNSAFRFEERLRSLETSFFEFKQTNQFADVVSAIPDIIHQYMYQQMKEAVQEAVQIQTDRLQDLLQRENDEFLRNIDENMKKVLNGLVKNQVKEQVSRNKSIQRSDEQRNLYKALVEAYEADKAILDTYGDSTILKRRREDDDQEGPSAGPNRGSKRQKRWSESAYAEEPMQTTCQMEETSLSVYETGADDQPTVQTSQHPEWFSQPRKPPSPDHAWNTALPAAQGDAQSWISDLAKQVDESSKGNGVMTKYGVTHRLATAYHPQTSGQVEVSSRGLKRILERTVGENRASWLDKLDDALWAFHTAFKTLIGCTPYKLLYRKSCHLPIELEHKVYWALKHANFDLKTTERTKKLHNFKIKNHIFNVGDQVLLFNSRLKIFSGKLKTHWSGPFTIAQVFPCGTVELSQPDGPNFKVNGHCVKHYFRRDIPSKVVLDLHTIPMDK